MEGTPPNPSERSDYSLASLEREDLLSDPIRQLQNWLDEARAVNIVEPTAMCLSTVDNTARPSSRMVLLRGLDERGLTFFTNYESRKGMELVISQHACLCFWWGELQRQVRVEGWCDKVTDEESDAYFNSRPYESQLASAASPQSHVISSREELESKVEELRAKYPTAVPRPAEWGGFRLSPDWFEFWQGRKARLHDRFRYRLVGEVWVIERLAP